MTIRSQFSAALLMLAGFAMQAQAVPIVVFASENSSATGNGAAAGSVNAGDTISITVSTTDLWSAGALPRWSNANGLTGNLLATGSDESGQAAGTLIGADFGLHSQDGLSAPFGALVGRIGSGNFFVVGANFANTATSSGILRLFYWDSNSGDNANSVTADVVIRTSAVPEPASIFLLGLGLLALGRFGRQRAVRFN